MNNEHNNATRNRRCNIYNNIINRWDSTHNITVKNTKGGEEVSFITRNIELESKREELMNRYGDVENCTIEELNKLDVEVLYLASEFGNLIGDSCTEYEPDGFNWIRNNCRMLLLLNSKIERILKEKE